MKQYLVATIAFLLCSSSAYASEAKPDTPAANLVQQAQELTGTNLMNNALGLALQGISLFQGSDGNELWRLKASWAHMSQEGDEITVDEPVMRYLLGDPGSEDFLDVTSEKGRVTDEQRHLALWGDVTLTRYDEKVTAKRMEYDSVTRQMVFPDGAFFANPKATGRASLFTWDLATNTMTGSNGVEIVLLQESDSAAKPEQKSSTTQNVTTEKKQ